MQWEDEKGEKKEALDSWIGLTEEELEFAENEAIPQFIKVVAQYRTGKYN